MWAGDSDECCYGAGQQTQLSNKALRPSNKPPPPPAPQLDKISYEWVWPWHRGVSSQGVINHLIVTLHNTTKIPASRPNTDAVMYMHLRSVTSTSLDIMRLILYCANWEMFTAIFIVWQISFDNGCHASIHFKLTWESLIVPVLTLWTGALFCYGISLL